MCLPASAPVDLWAIADPPDGQKPFASLPTLVKLAIHGSPDKRLTLQGICDALIARFAWFHEHRRDDAWKVRAVPCLLVAPRCILITHLQPVLFHKEFRAP